MSKKILVIDGEANSALNAAMTGEGYGCVHAASVQDAMSAAERESFDLAVLDAGTPEARTPDCISLLRAKGGYPIVVIASAGDRDKLIELLNAGAEDYLTRPFELRELVERVEIQLRRTGGTKPSGTLSHRELTMNPATFEVTLKGESIRLTKQEFKILELLLLSPPGRVFSKQEFYNYAWDCSYIGVDKTINVHVCNIRRKFREVTDEPYIETVWGLGFRLV